MWPAFAVLTLAEGVLFEVLPFSGDGPGGLVPALLLAAGLNLIVVAGLAPLAGMLLRRRRPDLPRAIAADHCGTVLLAALFASLVVAGLVNHSSVARDERDRAASYVAASRYVHAQAPEYADRLPAMDAVRVEVGMYRTCIPGADPERPLCLFVNTDQTPAGVTRDPERIPNALWRR
jgi:hypothetical protein